MLISHGQGMTRTRAVILTLSHLEKLEQRDETLGVMCQPALVFAGSDYTVVTSKKAGRQRCLHLEGCARGYNQNQGGGGGGIPWWISVGTAAFLSSARAQDTLCCAAPAGCMSGSRVARSGRLVASFLSVCVRGSGRAVQSRKGLIIHHLIDARWPGNA